MQPITAKNEFFDPADYACDVVGFFEELVAFAPGKAFGFKLLGHRRLDGLPTRPLGVAGRIEITITENLILRRGHKENKVKASPKKPIKCYASLEAICVGRAKQK